MLYPSATPNSLLIGSKAKEKQSSRLGQSSGGCPGPSREGKEQRAGPTGLCGLQHKVSVWIQAQELAELLHVFRAVLGLDHHYVSRAEPVDAAGPAEGSHRAGPWAQHRQPDQHPHQGRGHNSAKFPVSLNVMRPNLTRQRELVHGQDPHCHTPLTLSWRGTAQQGPCP